MNPAYSTTPKQSIAFPEVALIRKGNPKSGNTVGKDLNDKFRVQFYPGVDPAIIETFTKAYGKQPPRIKAFIPFPHIAEAFSSFNEAHNAGRMVAQADETHYLIKRDPLTGRYEVRYGEPFTPYEPGDKITYQRGDKTFELPLKTTNRLRLVIPEIIETGRLVTFTFKSTSLYDRFNLQEQLGAIQALANTLNRGNAAGIPFWLYRAEREITWNKPDGTAARIKKWLVHLEPDAEWVKNAWQRMSQMALSGGAPFVLASGSSAPLEVDEDFGEEEEEDDNDFFGEEPLETTARDVPSTPAPQPAPPARQTSEHPARRASRAQASSLPPTLPPAPKADPGAGELETLGKQMWNGRWETVKPTILKQGKNTQGALQIIKDRLATLNDLDGLLKHIETNWPKTLTFAPLAWGDVAERNGIVDPLLFLAALQAALPDLEKATTPRHGASQIVSHYPFPEPA